MIPRGPRLRHVICICRLFASSLLYCTVFSVAFLIVISTPARAAEVAKTKSFDIAANNALTTLRQFASQSGEQLVFSTEEVSGVRTQAVRGSMTGQEALTRMLAGTPLSASRDEKTGTFAVARVAGPNGQRAAQTVTPDRPLRSQPTKADERLANTTIDQTVKLSPFVVVESDHVGYAATSTLAGTRIKTDLRDLGSAISVVTPEFLADTGATGVEDFLIYTASTEIGGPQGNFSAAGLEDRAGRPNTDAARREPQAGARVRGLISPNYTRGYFGTNIPGDAYNTSGFTISRGANSLLFGLGSAAGVIDQALKGAQIGSNSGEVAFRFGAHESNRSTLDFNTTVIPRRLAIRVDSLYETERYQQDPAFDHERRIYVAVEGVAFENKKSRIFGRTVVRANVEAGKGKRNPPSPFAPIIGYESFFLPPPDYRPYTGLDYGFYGGYDMLAANFKKWAVEDTRPIPDPKRPGFYVAGWYETLESAQAQGRPDLVSKSHSSAHFFNDIALIYDVSSPALIGIPGSNLQGFQAQTRDSGTVQQSFVNTRMYTDSTGNGIGFKAPSLTDRAVFDYKNTLITGSMQEINRRFDAESITLEQSFLDGRAGLEATLDRQFYHLDYYQPFGGSNRSLPVYIDTTLYLSNGSPNPNVGRAFMLREKSDPDFWRNRSRDNKRVTAFVDLNSDDVRKGLGKWLGRHKVTGLWQKESTTNTGLDYGMHYTGVGFDYNRSVKGANNNTALQGVVQLAYISDDLRGKEMNEVRLNPVNFPRLRDGDTFNVSYYDVNPTIKPVPNTFRTGAVRVNRFIKGGNASRTDIASKALAWQSYLLNGKLVGLAGWRQDRIQNFRQITTNARSPINEYLPSNLQLNSEPALQPGGLNYREGNTFSWSAVGHMPRSVMRKLPEVVSGLSAHFSKSENFQAIQERHDIYNHAIPSPAGTTTEAGASIALQNNKWMLKVNRFETRSSNFGVLAEPTAAAINNIKSWLDKYAAAANSPNQYPFSAQQVAAYGYTSYDQVLTAIKNLMPESTRSAYNYTRNPSTGVWNASGTIQGLTSTSDVISKGWETELMANPTSQWRLSLNFAQVESTVSNSGKALKAYSDEVIGNMRKANLLDVLDSPDSSIVTMETRWNTQVVASLVSQLAKDGTLNQEQRKYRVNFVSAYDFGEGWLKGFGVGGAARWQSKVATGYQVELNELNQQLPIVDKPFFGPDEFNGDIWVNYSRRLTRRIRWKVQLNVRNLIGSQSDIPVGTNPDGTTVLYRIAPERNWFVTNTFSF
jgi:hypothetical protein